MNKYIKAVEDAKEITLLIFKGLGEEAQDAVEYISQLAMLNINSVVEESVKERTKLFPMHNEDGTLTQWYFDCEGHYIDVAKDEKGNYSIYFRERETDGEGWLDQVEQKSIDNLPKLPEPDTHCFDEDTSKDVWSYSNEQMYEYGKLCKLINYTVEK